MFFDDSYFLNKDTALLFAVIPEMLSPSYTTVFSYTGRQVFFSRKFITSSTLHKISLINPSESLVERKLKK